MRLLIQRVANARVDIANETVGQIDRGLLILLGIAPTDTLAEVTHLAGKAARLRIFEDDAGKMNRSVTDIGGACLVVSQFTLYGDCRKGNRPSFIAAAPPDHAIPLYEAFLEALRDLDLPVESGRFGADMQVFLQNDGPVTLWLEKDA